MTREEAIERFENIKANALVQKASGVSEYWQNEIDGTVEAIDMAIEALQTDLVRCKDCINYETCNLRLSHWWKGGYTVDIEFCSFGERREP